MSKDKFRKRKEARRRVRWAMEDRGIKGKDIAALLSISEAAVSQGCATSPRIVAALLAAGVPARLFNGKIPATPPLKPRGETHPPHPRPLPPGERGQEDRP